MLSASMELLHEVALEVEDFSPDSIKTSWRADGQVIFTMIKSHLKIIYHY